MMTNLEQALGVTFKDKTLLEQALRHSSAAGEMGLPRVKSNERLEFLGDAFFDAVIGEALYRALPEAEEGRLTKLRASVVCEEGLYSVAEELGLSERLALGGGHALTAPNRAMTADAMEAVIGAVYLDQGYETTKAMVLRLFADRIEAALSDRVRSDYKSAYQELRQRAGVQDIEYRLLSETGPAHDRRFTVALVAGGAVKAEGFGRSKKEAEQMAARTAYEQALQEE